MSQAALFQIHHISGVPVVDVEGDIDLTSAPKMEIALEQAARTGQRAVVLSLGGTAYFDSHGIHVMLGVIKRLQLRRQSLVVVLPRYHPLRAVFDAVGISASVRIVEALGEGVAAAQVASP